MKTCIHCNSTIKEESKRYKYCRVCRDKGIPRKKALKKYNASNKNKQNQKRYYYRDIKRTRKIKNKYNRSEKGKLTKKRYYEKNKKKIIEKNLKYYKKEMYSRLKAKKIKDKHEGSKKCEVCNTKENIHVHHKDFDVFNNELSNLQYLCSSCHGRIHEQNNLIDYLDKVNVHKAHNDDTGR